MNLFGWLLLCHVIGDFLIQTESQALRKAAGKPWNRAILLHCTTYTAVFVPAVLRLAIPMWWLAVLFASHWFLDRRWFVYWWRRNVTRNSAASIAATPWLSIVIDQAFHVLVLATIAASVRR